MDLLGSILPLIIQYGPQMVKDIVDLIHGNPQQQGETDDTYIARLKVLTAQNLQTASDENKQVEE